MLDPAIMIPMGRPDMASTLHGHSRPSQTLDVPMKQYLLLPIIRQIAYRRRYLFPGRFHRRLIRDDLPFKIRRLAQHCLHSL